MLLLPKDRIKTIEWFLYLRLWLSVVVGMIYNFVQAIRDLIPADTVFINARQGDIPARCVVVSDSGGTVQPWTGYTIYRVQVLTRDADPVGARELAYSIYNEFKYTFGLILPEITVNSVVYPATQQAQISADIVPQNLGADTGGRIIYTTNYRLIFG